MSESKDIDATEPVRLWASGSSESAFPAPTTKKRPPPGFVPPEEPSKRAQGEPSPSADATFAVPAPKKRPQESGQEPPSNDGFAVPAAKKKPPPGFLGQQQQQEQHVHWAPESKLESVIAQDDSERFLCEFENDDDDENDEEDDDDDDEEQLPLPKQRAPAKKGALPEPTKPKATWLESLLAFGTGSGANDKEDDEMLASSSSYFDSPLSAKQSRASLMMASKILLSSKPPLVCDSIPEGEEEGDEEEDLNLTNWMNAPADESEDGPNTERTYCEEDT